MASPEARAQAVFAGQAAIALALLLLLVAIKYYVNVRSAINKLPQGKIRKSHEWMLDRAVPASAESVGGISHETRKVAYLSGRFAVHTPRWQFVIWTRHLFLICAATSPSLVRFVQDDAQTTFAPLSDGSLFARRGAAGSSCYLTSFIGRSLRGQRADNYVDRQLHLAPGHSAGRLFSCFPVRCPSRTSPSVPSSQALLGASTIVDALLTLVRGVVAHHRASQPRDWFCRLAAP